MTVTSNRSVPAFVLFFSLVSVLAAQQPYPGPVIAAPANTLRSIGAAVAPAGDVNGDGAPDLVAGFPYQHNENSEALQDLIGGNSYAGTSGFHVWSPTTGAIIRTIVEPGLAMRGFAIANLGDIDGDGRPDHAVSNPVYTVSGMNFMGRVDAYSGATGAVIWSFISGVPGAFAGTSMARIADVDQDGKPDLLVGAIGYTTSTGRVFVISGATGASLRLHLGIIGDTLGFATSDVGDVNGDGVSDYAAGAPMASVNGTAPAPGYVRVWSGATGAVIRTVTGFSSFDRFGRALAPAGDLNGDNVPDMFVGSPARNIQSAPGRVYAINGATGAVLANMTRNVSADRFGWSLAAIGDRDGDGKVDVAVGTAVGLVEVRSGTTGGLLYVQSGLPGQTAQSGIVMRPTAIGDMNGDGFIDVAIGSSNSAANGLLAVFTSLAPSALLAGDDGNSVASDAAALGDLDGDGIRELAVSNARFTTQGNAMAGAVRVWSPGAGAFLGQLTGSSAGEFFGWNVTTLQDVDNDGVEDFLVSSVTGATDKVTCFSGATGQPRYVTTSPLIGGAFGYYMARLSDVDGDGIRDFAVGAPYTIVGAATTGIVYLCSGATGAIFRTINSPSPGGFFGARIADVGDVNGDGVTDLIVGAPYASPGGVGYAGEAHLVSGLTGWILRTHAGTLPGIACGYGVTGLGRVDGDLVPDYAVASPANTASGAFPAGPVVVYSGATGAVIRLLPPSAIPPGLTVNDNFGMNLSDAGDLDGDGTHDILLGASPYLSLGYSREVHAYSGATGVLIAREVGPPGGFQPFRPSPHAAGFDLTGDGVPDWVSFDTPNGPATAQFRIVTNAGIPFGAAIVGASCSPAGFPPPILQTAGGTIYAQFGNPVLELLVSRSAPNQNGILVAGATNLAWNGMMLPLDLGAYGLAGCGLYQSVDLTVPFTTTAAGLYGFPVPLPANPALAGTTAYVQAFVFSATGIPIASTNGLAITMQ